MSFFVESVQRKCRKDFRKSGNFDLRLLFWCKMSFFFGVFEYVQGKCHRMEERGSLWSKVTRTKHFLVREFRHHFQKVVHLHPLAFVVPPFAPGLWPWLLFAFFQAFPVKKIGSL